MFNSLTILIIFTHILILCSSSVNYAADNMAPNDNKQNRVEEIFYYYGEITSLTFNFSQRTETTARTRIGDGNAIFFRPTIQSGIMRWNYTSPDKQVVINDGHNISIYTENDKQMLVTPASALESDITYQLLNGNIDILKDFSIDFSPPPSNQNDNSIYSSIKITPKTPQNQLKNMRFWFDDHNIIHQIDITDHFETITTLKFTNIIVNNIQADDSATLSAIIDFTPPPGTEIIRQQ